MENVVLLIRWSYDREQVTISLGPDPRDNEIQHTDDYWLSLGRTVTYNTTSERLIRKDGSQQIKIHYLKEANPHLVGEFEPADLLWGTSIIVVSADGALATAEWQGDPPSRQYDGKCLGCRVLSQDLFKEEEREFVSRGKRKQQEFRRLLIDYQRWRAMAFFLVPRRRHRIGPTRRWSGQDGIPTLERGNEKLHVLFLDRQVKK